MEREYLKVVIGRLDGDGPNYEIRGLPEGADFRDPESYDRITAGALKLNGYGFSCSGAELAEHNETVTVRQEEEGGTAHILT